jgi:hypothetical protein
MKHIKYFNESIKHLLKPKSDELLRKELEKIRGVDRVDKALELGLNHLLTEEDILRDIEYLNDWKKFKLACKHNLLWLVKHLLKNDKDGDIHEVIKLGYSIARRLNNKEVYTFLDKYIESEMDDRNKMLNESIKYLLKPKSDEQVLKELEKLSDSDRVIKIIKYNLPYELLPYNLTVNGYLNCSNNQLTKLPDNLTVNGNLDCSNNQLTELPDNLTVKGNLYCYHNQLTKLPDNLTVNGDLYCPRNELTKLPDNLTVNGYLDCSNNQLTKLPDNLTVKGNLDCSSNQLPKNTKKPKGVKGEMYL